MKEIMFHHMSSRVTIIAFVLANFLSVCMHAQNRRPNIIYIMADDLGYGDLSCYGRKDYTTPNLDKLASRGTKFLNAYAAAPVCTPTRAAFMTGKYPARTTVGLYEPLKLTPGDSLVGLMVKDKSVAMLLKESGYETALIGKWHLGLQPQFSPLANGFDTFFGFYPGAIDYVSHRVNGKPALVEDDQPIHEEGYLTNLIARRSVNYIKGAHTKPFFLSVQFNAPHWPWLAPGDEALPPGTLISPALRQGGSPATFAKMMQRLDECVGEILKAVDDADIARNTIVIFTSDNGGEKFSNMGPYRGFKSDLTEGGIRVPAFISWPGVIPENTTTEQLAITMDWSVTILELAGVDTKKLGLDGVSLLNICKGREQPFERTFFWRTSQAKSQQAIRSGRWKYLKTDDGEYLFDLSIDAGEKNDLKQKSINTFEGLKDKYREWEKSVLKPVPL